MGDLAAALLLGGGRGAARRRPAAACALLLACRRSAAVQIFAAGPCWIFYLTHTMEKDGPRADDEEEEVFHDALAAPAPPPAAAREDPPTLAERRRRITERAERLAAAEEAARLAEQEAELERQELELARREAALAAQRQENAARAAAAEQVAAAAAQRLEEAAGLERMATRKEDELPRREAAFAANQRGKGDRGLLLEQRIEGAAAGRGRGGVDGGSAHREGVVHSGVAESTTRGNVVHTGASAAGADGEADDFASRATLSHAGDPFTPHWANDDRDRAEAAGVAAPTTPAATYSGCGEHYAELGLEDGASLAAVKQAYRRLVRDLHPDTAAEQDVGRFQAVQTAYKAICAGVASVGEAPSPGLDERNAADERLDVAHNAFLEHQRQNKLVRDNCTSPSTFCRALFQI